MIKLSIRKLVGMNGTKEIIKSKTISNVADEATNENLLKAGNAISALLAGENKEVLKIESTVLE